MVARQQVAGRDHQARSRRCLGDLDGGWRQRRQHREFGPHVHHAARQAGAQGQRAAGHRPPAPRRRDRARHQRLLPAGAVDQHRHDGRAAPSTSSACARATSPTLRDFAPRMEARMRQIPTVVDVNSDLQVRARSTVIDVDRDTASRLGLSVDQIRLLLYSAFGSRQVSTIYAADDTYQVILEADPRYADTSEMLRKIMMRTPSGALVPLDTVAKRSDKPTSLTVNHIAQLPVGDDLVQPGARHRARPGGRGDQGGGAARSACRPTSPPASRARRRCSSRPSPTRACCCSPPCW